jgi:hypothetical protein
LKRADIEYLSSKLPIMESKLNQREKGGSMVILTEQNYEAWSSICMDHLLAYPGPWDWIKSGVEPQFEVPPLEVPGQAPARRMQAAGRAQAQNVARGAARGRGRERRRNRGLEDVEELQEVLGVELEDEEDIAGAEPIMFRNPIFPGEAGKKVWKELLKDSAIERRKFKVDKNLAWAFIVKHIDATINNKIKLLPAYE